MTDGPSVTVTVEVTREVDVPLDLVATDDEHVRPTEIRERAEDWFWNYWREALANEPGPEKDDISVTSVVPPRSVYKTDDDERACTECGASVEDESYLHWLFHTCRDCAGDGGEADD